MGNRGKSNPAALPHCSSADVKRTRLRAPAGDGLDLQVLLETEAAWERFCDEVREFMGSKGPSHGEDPAFASLSPREREVLTLIAEGMSNAQIAERLSISEKTVRNHVSNLFDKLGVWTRAQAMVFALERGFKS